jgi:hypothetical protein
MFFWKHSVFVAPIQLQFRNNLPAVNRIEQNASTDVKLDCFYKGQPQPKVTWLKENKPLIIDGTTFQLRSKNGR